MNIMILVVLMFIMVLIIVVIIISMMIEIVHLELPKFSSASRWFSFIFASCSPFCSFTHSSISGK